MRFLPLSLWTGSFILTANLQSSAQLGQVPWWLWLVILLILLGLLIAGLFVREEPGHRYPDIQKTSPGIASDQISTGTELESDMGARTTAIEE